MLEYQLIEKGGNIAKRNFFGFRCFRSGLNIVSSTFFSKNNLLRAFLCYFINCVFIQL